MKVYKRPACLLLGVLVLLPLSNAMPQFTQQPAGQFGGQQPQQPAAQQTFGQQPQAGQTAVPDPNQQQPAQPAPAAAAPAGGAAPAPAPAAGAAPAATEPAGAATTAAAAPGAAPSPDAAATTPAATTTSSTTTPSTNAAIQQGPGISWPFPVFPPGAGGNGARPRPKQNYQVKFVPLGAILFPEVFKG